MPEEQVNDHFPICPYCEKEIRDLDTDHDGEWEEECPDCGMKFRIEGEITIQYSTRPDCNLNGQRHIDSYERGYHKCMKCGFISQTAVEINWEKEE